jgi:RNA polymerase sigma-70 factor (ECF subfamily)
MEEPHELSESSSTRTRRSPADDAAEELFLGENLRRIYLLIFRIVGNSADAQDLTQETFIKALQRRDQLRDYEKAAHWLSRIAANTALDFLRRHGRHQALPLEELADPPRTRPEASPEQRLLRGEQSRMLQAGLDRLTERERVALVLRDVEDLPAAGSRAY